MDKIEKVLRKMNSKELELIELVLLAIKRDYSLVLGIIKLKGAKDLFRVRVGRFQLIFRISGKVVEVVRISKRNETTYKSL